MKNEILSFNFRDIQVRELLELLAEFKHLNLIISDDVDGTISLHLQQVSWSQALDAILAMRGLGKRQQGNILLIAKASQLAESAAQAQDAQSLSSELMTVYYAKAAELGEIMENKSSHLLSERGSISIDPRSNKIWVKDTPERLLQIRKFLRGMDIPAQQVHIAARIVNIDEDCINDLGIKFGQQSSGGASGSANTMVPGHLNFAIAYLGAASVIDVELAALVQNGQAEIISKPELITENRQIAEIESGQEIPYQQGTSSGATNIAFKKAVLGLKVTPEITADHKILLSLKVNQDQVSPLTVNGVPAIQTQAIETRILVQDGQTLVLGGIIEQSQSNVVGRVPFLSAIPLLGRLFTNTEHHKVRKELLIFITPKVIS